MTQRYMTTQATQESPEFIDLMRRRVQPLLDTMGTSTRSLEHLMMEAYRIGMLDAIDTIQKTPTET